MRYEILRRGGMIGSSQSYDKFAEANWLADAEWIVRSLSTNSPVRFDVRDTQTGIVRPWENIVQERVPGAGVSLAHQTRS